MSANTPDSSHHLVARVDLEAAAEFGWGKIHWLVNRELSGNTEITFGIVEIAPGAKNPRHRHPNCDEVLYVMDGELEHGIGEDFVRLQPGTALLIPRDVPHDARNTGVVMARLVVSYSTGDRETVLC